MRIENANYIRIIYELRIKCEYELHIFVFNSNVIRMVICVVCELNMRIKIQIICELNTNSNSYYSSPWGLIIRFGFKLFSRKLTIMPNFFSVALRYLFI